MPIEVVVDVSAFHHDGLLGIQAQDAERGIRIAKAAVERVLRVVGEAERALERRRTGSAQLLGLVGVFQ